MVFRTISDNIRSFFLKEEELEQEPKKAPDAAVELFERPLKGSAQEHRIVEHRLQPERPKLPFSSGQLRERLAAAQAPVEPRKSVRDEPEIDISSQIAEFEQAMSGIPVAAETVSRPNPSASPVASAPSASLSGAQHPPPRRRDGYFSDVAKLLKERGYDDGLLAESVDRMKEHHARRSANAQYEARVSRMEQALAHKLAELQGLEHDWATKHDEIEAAEERMASLEEAIIASTEELKALVATMRSGVLNESSVPLSASPSFPADSPSAPSSSPSSLSSSTVPSSPSNPVPLPVAPPAVPAPSSDVAPFADAPPRAAPSVVSAPSAPVSPVVPTVSVPLAASPPPAASPPSVPAAPATSSGRSAAPIGPSATTDDPFRLADGRLVFSLAELKLLLPTMDDGVFYHHLSPSRNDFAAWIRDVFHDALLAERVAHASSKYVLAASLP